MVASLGCFAKESNLSWTPRQILKILKKKKKKKKRPGLKSQVCHLLAACLDIITFLWASAFVVGKILEDFKRAFLKVLVISML